MLYCAKETNIYKLHPSPFTAPKIVDLDTKSASYSCHIPSFCIRPFLLLELFSSPRHDQPNDQSKQTQDTTEHLHNQNLDKQLRIRSIRHSCITTRDSHSYSATQVAHAHRQPTPKQNVSGKIIRRGVEGGGSVFEIAGDFGREDDGHDDAVDRYDFAEDDAAEGVEARNEKASSEGEGAWSSLM